MLFSVDAESLILLQGCTIDLEVSMAREGYIVADNPNADHSCSCKKSFAPKSSLFG